MSPFSLSPLWFSYSLNGPPPDLLSSNALSLEFSSHLILLTKDNLSLIIFFPLKSPPSDFLLSKRLPSDFFSPNVGLFSSNVGFTLAKLVHLNERVAHVLLPQASSGVLTCYHFIFALFSFFGLVEALQEVRPFPMQKNVGISVNNVRN